jgi:hypothetical protein
VTPRGSAIVFQGRVGAPPLTHLRGKAAIAFSRNAASRLKFGACETMPLPLALLAASNCNRVGQRESLGSGAMDPGVVVSGGLEFF